MIYDTIKFDRRGVESTESFREQRFDTVINRTRDRRTRPTVAEKRGLRGECYVIGATNWVDNYNIPLLSSDINVVRRITKRVSGRGGGLPSVQAMALAHGKGVIEVACNLLDPNKVSGERVQEEVEILAREEGISVERRYYTDFSQDQIISSYFKLFQNRI
ncbi:uncharacterized protein HKW66_Vig0047580 [Vigna angularis]|uniref:Formiminotransferase C-terminal subdomain domain-containing protein n=1 Tax=Phaseolus angularis TaxID=3914 RepID=A0A8T0L5B1_PHAAN|nr:uncharacterized protein HKW66_Vig0047580 [Vigna angularis]